MSGLNKNGVSTTQGLNEFGYEIYHATALGGMRVQWDYRDGDGVLHTGIAKTLSEARNAAAKFGYKRQARK